MRGRRVQETDNYGRLNSSLLSGLLYDGVLPLEPSKKVECAREVPPIQKCVAFRHGVRNPCSSK
jgi:hypothetical protein